MEHNFKNLLIIMILHIKVDTWFYFIAKSRKSVRYCGNDCFLKWFFVYKCIKIMFFFKKIIFEINTSKQFKIYKKLF
jgi:hypothetical protein